MDKNMFSRSPHVFSAAARLAIVTVAAEIGKLK